MKTRSYSNAKNSRFKTHIRIDPAMKQWLDEHRDTRTTAGFADKIFNEYRKRYENQETTNLAGADGPTRDQTHPAPSEQEGAALPTFSSRD